MDSQAEDLTGLVDRMGFGERPADARLIAEIVEVLHAVLGSPKEGANLDFVCGGHRSARADDLAEIVDAAGDRVGRAGKNAEVLDDAIASPQHGAVAGVGNTEAGGVAKVIDGEGGAFAGAAGETAQTPDRAAASGPEDGVIVTTDHRISRDVAS